MRTSQLIIGVLGFVIFWIAIRFIANHKNVLSKPEGEQKKLKNQLYWSMALALLFYFGVQLLINSKTTVWINWAVISAYFSLWLIGGYSIFKAYVIGVKKNLSQVKKLNGLPFNQPHKFVRATALTNLLAGLSLWLLVIAIPFFHIKLAAWAPFIVVIGSLRKIAYSKFEKEDATS